VYSVQNFRMQKHCGDATPAFEDIEPVLGIVASFLENDSLAFRRVCRVTRNLRAKLNCGKLSQIPKDLEELATTNILAGTLVPKMNYLKVIKLRGKLTIYTSALRNALFNAPLEQFTCSVLLQQDIWMDELVAFLLEKRLTVLQLDEFVSDAVLPLIGAHPCLRKLAISIDGDASMVEEIAKCSTLKSVRLEVPESYPSIAFQSFSKLAISDFELNGRTCFNFVQSSMVEIRTMSFNDHDEVDLDLLNCTKLRKLEICCDSATGTLEALPLIEWLVLKVRNYWVPMSPLARLRVLCVSTLFVEDVQSISANSPLLNVFEFGLYHETAQEKDFVLAALSTLTFLEWVGVYCDHQTELQGIKDACSRLKMLVLDGEEFVPTEMRVAAAKRNIFFDNSDMILNFARPDHSLF